MREDELWMELLMVVVGRLELVSEVLLVILVDEMDFVVFLPLRRYWRRR